MTENLNPNKDLFSNTTNITNVSSDDKPSGISKHLYSTNPDAITGENIYANNKTSMNREESYQTLDNRTVPQGTSEKVNPFNVKGVPGCKECGGSGWKDSVKNPHPCNECAKKTVPVIDTYMTKVGQTMTPSVVESSNYTTTTTSEMKTSTPITENVEVKYKEPVAREETITKEVPITREYRTIENVPVTTQVPVTRYEEVTQNVPVEKVSYHTETVPVTSTQTVIDSVERTKVIPVTKDFVTESIPVRSDETFTRTGITSDVDRNIQLLKDTHIHDSRRSPDKEHVIGHTAHSGHFDIEHFQGIPGCKECKGDGWRRSKLTGAKKPCKTCIAITGNCPLCANTGMRLDKNKKCKCKYAKAL